MDWIKWLNLFRIREKLKFTLQIFLIIIVTLSLIWLFNGLAAPKSINIVLEFLRSIFSTDKKGIFVPEVITVLLFTLVVVWILLVVAPLVLRFCQEITALVTKLDCLKTRRIFIDDCLNALTYQGKVEKTGPRSLSITNSDSGVLIKHHFWKDFSITFNFNLETLKQSAENDYVRSRGDLYEGRIHRPKNNYFGFIFRALDLDNYFMISVGIKDVFNPDTQPRRGILKYVRQLLITPHARVNGRWDVFSSEPYPDDKKTKLKEDKSHSVTIEVRGNKLELSFKEIMKPPYIWQLPTNFRSNWPSEREKIRGEEYIFGDESVIPFYNSFGKIGFRAYGEEHVIIEDLVVTQI